VTLHDPALGFAEVQQTVLFSIAACGTRAQGRSQLPTAGSPSGSKSALPHTSRNTRCGGGCGSAARVRSIPRAGYATEPL